MKLARYLGSGRVELVDEPEPSLPEGGLLVRAEACGLCSGELMAWYLDRKLPHVLGHEVAGVVIASDDPRFAVGTRIAPHHHVACRTCPTCLRGAEVHCPSWKRAALAPGGMAERFAVAAEALPEAFPVDDLRPVDAALAEPLACVVKSLRRAGWSGNSRAAVVGLGSMGLLHMRLLGPGAVGFERSAARRAWARALGLDAREPAAAEPAFETVFVCPGNASALALGARLVVPGGTLALFAPFGAADPELDLDGLYFRDVALATSYSAGPRDMREALDLLRASRVRAEDVVSDFVALEALPEAYRRMRDGEILKAMVVFEPPADPHSESV